MNNPRNQSPRTTRTQRNHKPGKTANNKILAQELSPLQPIHNQAPRQTSGFEFRSIRRSDTTTDPLTGHGLAKIVLTIYT